MSALDKVLTAHGQVVALTNDDPRGEQEREQEAMLLASAASSNLDEAVRLILAGNPVPAELLLSAQVALHGLDLPPDKVELSGWVEHTAQEIRLASSDGKKPYGDVEYADPGYQSDGKKRYPLDTEANCRAAWSYINQGDNSSAYSSADLAKVKNKIKAACKRLGIDISESDSSGKVAASAIMLAAQAPMVESELLHVPHRPMHGVHAHAHIHLNDNRHGPSRVALAMAAGAGWGGAGNIKAISSAHVHKPMTGAHVHPHVHAGDATHGPMQELSDEAKGAPDSSW